jgi:transposase-like protein
MARRRNVPSGTCTVCPHLERTRAELLLAEGASFASVARKYSVNRESLRRHWLNHVSAERKASLVIGPVQRAALAARVSEENSGVLDHLKIVRAGLYALYDAAVTAGDRTTGAMLAGRLHENLAAVARLTGQLAMSPLVQVNQTNIFMHDPAFAGFMADLIRALSPFPDARAAVLAEFEGLERAGTAVPLLEHQHAND